MLHLTAQRVRGRGEAKKLSLAARHLVRREFERQGDSRGADDGSPLERDMTVFQLPERLRQAVEKAMTLPQDQPQEFYLWRAHEPAFNAFVALWTQWSWTGGMDSQRAGLPFERIESYCRMTRVPTSRRGGLLAELRVMEAAALECFAEQRDQANRARRRRGEGKGARQ